MEIGRGGRERKKKRGKEKEREIGMKGDNGGKENRGSDVAKETREKWRDRLLRFNISESFCSTSLSIFFCLSS